MKLVRNKRILVVGFAVVIAILAYYAIRSFAGVSTSYVKVERSPLLQTVVATGRIESPARIEIASRALGHITKMLVDEGDEVVAGQILVELDAREAKANREQAVANLQIARARLEQLETVASHVAEENLKQAKANFQLAQTDYRSAQQLYREGVIPQNQFDATKLKFELAKSALQTAKTLAQSQRRSGADFKLAQLAVREAEARFQVADVQLQNLSIVAPVAGMVVMRAAELGDVAQPGKVLLVLAKQGPVQAVADVDEKNLAHLRLGQKAWILADAFVNERVAANLQFIAPAIDAGRGTVEIKLDIDQPPAYLKPGMTVNVEIVARQIDNALVLPMDAVHDLNKDRPWVVAVNDQHTVRKEIVLGAKGDGIVQIVSGLGEGDSVIPSIEAKIGVGQKVRLREQSGH